MGYDMSCYKEEINALEDNSIFDQESAQIEDVACRRSSAKFSTLAGLFGEINIAIFSEENFNEVIEHLPVIARNKLVDSQSKNLWYEEVVPRESILYTAMLDYSSYGCRVLKKSEFTIECFYGELQKELIQVGANASIGFGLCRFDALGLTSSEEV
jgi:CRISPR-associated protein Cmr4